METMKKSACEALQVLMALWWLYGGYVFPVVVSPENLTFLKSNLTSKVKVNCQPQQ